MSVAPIIDLDETLQECEQLRTLNEALTAQLERVCEQCDHLIAENARMEKMLDNIVANAREDACATSLPSSPNTVPYRVDPWGCWLANGNVISFEKEVTLERRLRASIRRLGL